MPIDHCAEPNGCTACDGPVTNCCYIEDEEDYPEDARARRFDGGF